MVELQALKVDSSKPLYMKVVYTKPTNPEWKALQNLCNSHASHYRGVSEDTLARSGASERKTSSIPRRSRNIEPAVPEPEEHNRLLK